ARALGLRGASATVAWGLGALGPALLLVFVVHGSILLALVTLGVVGVVALPFALRVVSGPPAWDTVAIAFLGLAFGVALWHVAGVVTGDALFHLGRVQKLYSFGNLRVRSTVTSCWLRRSRCSFSSCGIQAGRSASRSRQSAWKCCSCTRAPRSSSACLCSASPPPECCSHAPICAAPPLPSRRSSYLP